MSEDGPRVDRTPFLPPWWKFYELQWVSDKAFAPPAQLIPQIPAKSQQYIHPRVNVHR